MKKDINIVLKGLPIGESSIKEIINGKYIYVDKTEYIYNIITKNKYYFLSRPWRFGKSLLISTLFEIFSGNKELFKDCSIYNSNHDWKKHPIIHLDFSEIKRNNSDEFKKGSETELNLICKKYEIDLTKYDSGQTKIKFLIKELYEKYNEQVVILVDEYDKRILDNITNLEIAKENRIIMFDIYTIMKSSNEYIRFQFITGITKFTQTLLFSGPNNLKDISMDVEYNNLLGYTQDEKVENQAI